MTQQIESLTGRVVGHLTVIGPADPIVTWDIQGPHRRLAWACRCECGAVVVVLQTQLRAGRRQWCSSEKHRAAITTKARSTHRSFRTLTADTWGGADPDWDAA